MLNIIRNNVQSLSVKFIVGIICLVMAFFGVSSFRESNVNVIADVDEYSIKTETYQRAYDRAQMDARKQYGAQADFYLKAVNIPGQIVRQLVNGALLKVSAKQNGFSVTDLEVADTIYHDPTFETDNRFNPKKYEKFLESLRLKKLDYENDLKDQLLTQKYLRFFSSGISYSRKFIDQEYKRYNTTMDAELLKVTPELFKGKAKVSEKEVKAYYEANHTKFEQKAQYALNYFVVKTDDVKNSLKVKDKEITKYYENHKADKFTVNDSFRSRHILFSMDKGEDQTIRTASQVYAKLMKDKRQFAALAEKYSRDPGSASKGGELGWVEKGTFVKEFEQKLSKMKKGEITRPFKTTFGYHIIQLLDTKSGYVKSLEDVKSEVRQTVLVNKAKRKIKNRVARLVKNKENKSFAELATTSSKKTAESGLFDDVKVLKTIGYTGTLYRALKDKKVGDIGSHAINADETVIYEVSKISKPFIKPFNEVEKEAEQLALKEAEKKMATEKMKEYAKTIKTEQQFKALAKSLNAPVETEQEFEVSAKSLTAPAETEQEFEVSAKSLIESVQFKLMDTGKPVLKDMDFKISIYKMKNGEVRNINKGMDQYLVLLKNKKESQKEISSQELIAIESQLQRQKANIFLNGLLENMHKEVDVKYNTAILNALKVKLNS